MNGCVLLALIVVRAALNIVPLIIGGTEAALDLAAALQARADLPFDLFVLPVSLTKEKPFDHIPHSNC